MTFLPRYITGVVAKEWSAEDRRRLLNAWIDRFAGEGALSCAAGPAAVRVQEPEP
jgi:hypothetical protein